MIGCQDRNPLVSIVVPTFNHAKYLPEAIDSLLGQSYSNLEIIILDDGSTDNTRTILEGYGNEIRWETQSNMGHSRTLNKGWRMSRGDVIGYLNADDILYPDAIRISVECLQDNASAVGCYPNFLIIDPDSRRVRSVSAPSFDIYKMITQFECAPGPGALFLKSAFERAGGWNEELKQTQDFEYWLRLARYGNLIHIPFELAAFRVHERSQSFGNIAFAAADEPIAVIESYYQNNQIPDELLHIKKQALANAHFVAAQLHLRSARYWPAIIRIADAISMSPISFCSKRILRVLAHGLFYRPLHRLSWLLRRS